jgi:hypothetical protein
MVAALVAVAAGWAGVGGTVAVASPQAASNKVTARLKDKTSQIFKAIFFVIEPWGILHSLQVICLFARIFIKGPIIGSVNLE